MFMNKSLLLFLLVSGCCYGTFAQPVFTSVDNPQAGDVFTYYNCVVSSPGVAGANVTWDFSAATASSSYQGRYDLCSGSPDCATFPGSNMVLKYPSLNTEKFLILDADRYTTNGLKLPADNYIYSKAFDNIRYPFHYGDTYTDSLAATFTYNGTTYLERGHFTNTYDAWGTLKLPTGTFTNVLRMHQVETYYHSDLSGTIISRDSIVQYTWHAPGYHEYLFSFSKTYKNAALAYTAISYSNQFLLGVTSINSVMTKLTAFPNPVKDELHLTFNMERNDAVHIGLYDMIGKELAVIDDKMFSAGLQDLSYKIPGLARGIYVLRLQTTSGGSISKKIEVW
jgi:hypothetical protein